jgi:hypothetical protein
MIIITETRDQGKIFKQSDLILNIETGGVHVFIDVDHAGPVFIAVIVMYNVINALCLNLPSQGKNIPVAQIPSVLNLGLVISHVAIFMAMRIAGIAVGEIPSVCISLERKEIVICWTKINSG